MVSYAPSPSVMSYSRKMTSDEQFWIIRITKAWKFWTCKYFSFHNVFGDIPILHSKNHLFIHPGY